MVVGETGEYCRFTEDEFIREGGQSPQSGGEYYSAVASWIDNRMQWSPEELVELDELAKDVVNNLRDHAEKEKHFVGLLWYPISGIRGVQHILYEMLYNNAVMLSIPSGEDTFIFM